MEHVIAYYYRLQIIWSDMPRNIADTFALGRYVHWSITQLYAAMSQKGSLMVNNLTFSSQVK